MKSKLIKSTLIIVTMVLISTQVWAQEKPFRIGVKAGFPNIVSGNIEFVTPLADNKLSVMLDYSNFSFDFDVDDPEELVLDYSYFEIGLNYYFVNEGKGPYVSLSYTNMSLDLAYDNIESDNTPGQYGSATAGIGMNTMNIKLGAKWGGLIYFRPEIGFSFTPLPNTINAEVHFPDQTVEFHTEEIPSQLTGGLIFNIGFGFSF
jgi:hypothetical protein